MSNDENDVARSPGILLPALCVVAGSILYSGKGIFGKSILRAGASVADLMALRTLWAAPFYLAILLWVWRRGRPGLRDVGHLLAMGVCGFWLAPRLTFEGLGHVSAGLERILIQASTAWIVALLWLRHRKAPSRAVLAALVVCYAGLVLACLGQDEGRASADPVGVLLILGGTLVWGGFVVGIGPLQARCGAVATTSTGMLVAAFASAVESGLRGRIPSIATPSSRMVLPLAGLVLLSTVLPSFLTQGGLRRIGPMRTGLLSLAGPSVVPLLAAGFLGERMSMPQLAGLALVVGASVPLGLRRD